MATVMETARNFRALKDRKRKILDACNAALCESLDDILANLGRFGGANGFWGRLLKRIKEAHRL